MTPADELPTTPERWTEDLVLALRLADVRGTAIGDAVRVVEDHCEQTGEHPQEAFGPPDDYARALAASLPPAALAPSGWRRPAAVAVAVTAGTLFLLAGVTGVAGGQPAVLRVSDLAVVVGVVVAALVVQRLMSGLVRRVWPVAVALALGIAVPVALATLVPGELFTMPAAVALGYGAAVLASTAVALTVGMKRHVDPVVDPVSGEDTRPTPWTVRVALLAPVVLLAAGVLAAAKAGLGT